MADITYNGTESDRALHLEWYKQRLVADGKSVPSLGLLKAQAKRAYDVTQAQAVSKIIGNKTVTEEDKQKVISSGADLNSVLNNQNKNVEAIQKGLAETDAKVKLGEVKKLENDNKAEEAKVEADKNENSPGTDNGNNGSGTDNGNNGSGTDTGNNGSGTDTGNTSGSTESTDKDKTTSGSTESTDKDKTDTTKTNSVSNELKDGTKVVGAGTSGSDLANGGIMSFAELINKASYVAQQDSGFIVDGATTVHAYLSKSMQRYYHQIYYIPNLQKNMCMIIKPETLFVYAPSCNLIFPNMKSNISFSRNFKSEPTRLIQVTDPLSGIGAKQGGLFSLMCLMFIEQEQVKNKDGTLATRYGLPLYKTKVSTSTEHTKLTEKSQNPMALITNYEKENGIFGSRSNEGTNTYMFLATAKESSKGSKKGTHYSLNESDKKTVGGGLARLACYGLLKQRYASRTGSISMYFDPYIVPGFPFVSLESSSEGCNIYGYVTSIAHSFTDRSWNTMINFNCAHFDYEDAPAAFPIVEAEYTTNLPATYKDMLGDTVVPVHNVDIPRLTDSYFAERQKLSTSLRRVWRPLTDLDEYLKDIADEARICTEKNFKYIKGTFFNSQLQERIKQYSDSIMNKQLPMSNADIR